MKGWTWDDPYRRPTPKPQHGTGYALTETEPSSPGFVKDEKTGLLLPEGTKVRPVKIGFQPRKETP